MKDGLFRRFIKKIALLSHSIDLAITRRSLGPPPYILKGECNGCGACCVNPTIHLYPPFFYVRSIRWMYITWHRVINGFKLVEENRKDKTLVFECTHYDPTTKLCDSYDSRPGMCRDYPKNMVYLPNPEFFEECSYTAEYRYAQGMREALEKTGLSEEKLKELKKKLHIEE